MMINEEQATLCSYAGSSGRIVIECSDQVEKMFRLRRQTATGWLAHQNGEQGYKQCQVERAENNTKESEKD
jgi:hypothetical protein